MASAGKIGFFLHEELKAIVMNSIDVEIRKGHFLVMCIIIYKLDVMKNKILRYSFRIKVKID